MIPSFALNNASVPQLREGQETIVYEALCPYPEVRALDELVERCCELGHKETMKRPPAPGEVWASVLWHLNRMKERGIVREIVDGGR